MIQTNGSSEISKYIIKEVQLWQLDKQAQSNINPKAKTIDMDLLRQRNELTPLLAM